LRLAFAGTPPFAATVLRSLLEARHEVVLVLTQPDRAKGRGLKSSPSAVSLVAQAEGLPQSKPVSLADPAEVARIAAADLDAVVVAAYGLLLPSAVLALPRRGCLNVHASLLPRWRGAAPVQRAIIAGDAQTGVSIMQMEAGLDTGPVWLQRALPIAPEATAGTLTDELARLGARAMVEVLARLEDLQPAPQPERGVTYASKILRGEAGLDWSQPAQALARRVRAFDPFPGAETTCRDERLKVWRAQPVPGSGSPGEVVGVEDGAPVVACGSGFLLLHELQRPGGRRLAANVFQQGFPVPIGERLG